MCVTACIFVTSFISKVRFHLISGKLAIVMQRCCRGLNEAVKGEPQRKTKNHPDKLHHGQINLWWFMFWWDGGTRKEGLNNIRPDRWSLSNILSTCCLPFVDLNWKFGVQVRSPTYCKRLPTWGPYSISKNFSIIEGGITRTLLLDTSSTWHGSAEY